MPRCRDSRSSSSPSRSAGGLDAAAALVPSTDPGDRPMNIRSRLLAFTVAATALGMAVGAQAAASDVNLGVAIPAATHSFTAGIVFWANQAKKDLEKEHPGIKVTIKTAGGAPEQAN